MKQTLFVLILFIFALGFGLYIFRLKNSSKEVKKQTKSPDKQKIDTDTPSEAPQNKSFEFLKNKKVLGWLSGLVVVVVGYLVVPKPEQLLPYLVIVPLVFFVSYYAGNKEHYKNMPRAIISSVLTALVLVLVIHPGALQLVFGPVVGSVPLSQLLKNGNSGMVWLFGFTAVYCIWKGQVVAAAIVVLIFLTTVTSGFCPP